MAIIYILFIVENMLFDIYEIKGLNLSYKENN
jgi:hypothetical protein